MRSITRQGLAVSRNRVLRAAAWAAGIVICTFALAPQAARAQDEGPPITEVAPDTSKAKAAELESYRNEISGEMTPGRGFDLFRAKRGSLNVSFYGVFRYINQLPGDQTYKDHASAR